MGDGRFGTKWLTLNESDVLESRRRSVINSARFAIDESAIKAERVARDAAGNKFRLRMDLFLNRPTGIPVIPRRASFVLLVKRYAKMHTTMAYLCGPLDD